MPLFGCAGPAQPAHQAKAVRESPSRIGHHRPDAQCIITMTMTGWWIIGGSPTPILRNDPDKPFLFDVGDGRFRRIQPRRFRRRRQG
jgi:hypothetical protein